jgi:transketolase
MMNEPIDLLCINAIRTLSMDAVQEANNHITIEGHTDMAFSDDVATRFISYGWNVTRVGDANDLGMLDRAFQTFKNTHDRVVATARAVLRTAAH